MAGQILKWLQQGYPYIREASQLPCWVLPEHSFARITDELGDEGVLEMSQPLGVAQNIVALLKQAAEPDTVSPDDWRAAVKLWPLSTEIKHMVTTILGASEEVLRQFEQGQLKVEPGAVCRHMAVISLAPFVPEGKGLVKELASILNSQADKPHGLVMRYAKAVIGDETTIWEQVDRCIARNRRWSKWAMATAKRAIAFPYTPRPIGVTPPLSTETISMLVEMIKEVTHDDSGRDYPENNNGQIRAR